MTERTPKTYYVKTYGCQMNVRDSETIAGILQGLGLAPAQDMTEADVILVNTCTVRDKAEQKVYGLLGRFRELKEENPDLILGVCGCMPQQIKVAKHLRSRYPYLDIIIGTHNLNQLAGYMQQVLNERRQVFEIWEERATEELAMPSHRTGKFKAFVNISWGCNNFCTYCIVPYVRGREKSRDPQSILEEITGLAKEGFVEITLLGQNVNSYGKDLPGKPDFARLLKVISAIPGIGRIRFMTSHPKDVSERLIAAMAALPKVCNHLHLPLQAGSNRILGLMNRGYTREHYLDLVRKIRSALPEIALTTDIIVGFPGETEADFLATLEIIEQVRFDSAFTFMYSPRAGTPAASMEEQLAQREMRERLQRLNYVQNAISLECNQELVGTTQEILVDEWANNKAKGRTTTNKLVFFDSPQDLTGTFVDVKITEAKTWSLAGELGDEA